MSDKWLYRIYGQEFGPVSLDLVRTLVAAGTIAPDDEVRDASRSNWILACAAAELSDSLKSPTSNLAVERRAVRDEWFCRGAAGDYGPLKLIDLIQLAAEGGLRPDEEIKARADDYWKQVSSIQRLVELLPFADQNHQPRSEVSRPNLVKTDRLFKRDGSNKIDSTSKEAAPAFEEADIIPFPGGKITSSTGDDNNELLKNGGQAPRYFESRPICEDGWSQSPFFQQAAKAGPDFETEDGLDSLKNALASCDAISDMTATYSIGFWDQQGTEQGTEQAQWFGWIGGEEFGPVSYSELLTWAVTGRLSPMDFVRRCDEEAFVPAVNIPSLFTVRAAADANFRRTVSMASIENSELDSEQNRPNDNVENGQPADVVNADPSSASEYSANDARETSAHSITSIVTNLMHDRNSIGLSAVVAIGIVVLVWMAGL